MKKVYLFTVCCLTLFIARASDTLTRTQIYNFSVGDTFDYKDSSAFDNGGPASGSGVSYRRFVIDRVYYSTNSDTLTIVRRKEFPLPVSYDSLVISSLASYEISNYSQQIHGYGCDSTLMIDSTSIFNGKKINGVSGICFESYFDYRFCEGLGEVYRKSGGGSSSDGYSQTIRTLIYYSKGTEHWGTPILTSGSLLHYTPIPEECASWTADIYSDFPWSLPSHLGIREQIRSGSRIGFHGHTYVEMIYRSYDYQDHYFISDSLIGYYRNDTTNKKTLFYKTLSDTSYLEYDFNYLCPAPGCLTQVLVGGQPRTKWAKYIEGVGGVVGLVPVQRMLFQPGGQTFTWGATYFSFCVCGQILYSTDTTISCEMISSVDELKFGYSSVCLSPNPSTTSFTIQLPSPPTSQTYFQLYDALGRAVKREEIVSETTTMPRNNLPSGIYFWQLQQGNKILDSGKVVME